MPSLWLSRSSEQEQRPHPLVVPIRDVKTREVLPGRTIGVIGPKAGTTPPTMDSCSLSTFVSLTLTSSRVSPRSNPRLANTSPTQRKLAYGTLTWVRANFVA